MNLKNIWRNSRASFKTSLWAAVCACSALMSQTASAWDLWDQFAAEHIDNGRVVDTSDSRRITTSEGQSYALFFALVANDRPAFEKLLAWTENNLAEGDLTKHLPAWLWGRQRNWGVLDSNNASDSDLWIAWCLLEADRLWKVPAYRAKALGMMELLLTRETRQVAGLGPVVLPGHAGFEEGKAENRQVKLNPSYMPIFLLRRLALEDTRWQPITDAALAMLVRSSPSGLAPEWARFSASGRLVKPEGEDYTDGSYNAIRTYLWVGITSPEDPSRNLLAKHFAPMVALTREGNFPPRHVNVVTGETESVGPDYFGACLLPLLKSSRAEDARAAAVIRTVLAANPVQKDRYYGNVLTLFGLGFDAGMFALDGQGRLITGPDWRKPHEAKVLKTATSTEAPKGEPAVEKVTPVATTPQTKRATDGKSGTVETDKSTETGVTRKPSAQTTEKGEGKPQSEETAAQESGTPAPVINETAEKPAEQATKALEKAPEKAPEKASEKAEVAPVPATPLSPASPVEQAALTPSAASSEGTK